MDHSIISKIQGLGLTDKASRLYWAACELEEGSVQELAIKSGLKRTTVYSVLPELIDKGALIQVRRLKRLRYIPESPEILLGRVREGLDEFSLVIPQLSSKKNKKLSKPKIYFLYGVPGFKQVWDRIFKSGEKEYRIITSGVSFLSFVKEKYVLSEIIETKKRLGIRSRQLIVDSNYARSIVSKDKVENRVSKILPSKYKQEYTQVITGKFVVFVSTRFENICLLFDNEGFAKNQANLFDAMWDKL